jgi:hypothetical protein
MKKIRVECIHFSGIKKDTVINLYETMEDINSYTDTSEEGKRHLVDYFNNYVVKHGSIGMVIKANGDYVFVGGSDTYEVISELTVQERYETVMRELIDHDIHNINTHVKNPFESYVMSFVVDSGIIDLSINSKSDKISFDGTDPDGILDMVRSLMVTKPIYTNEVGEEFFDLDEVVYWKAFDTIESNTIGKIECYTAIGDNSTCIFKSEKSLFKYLSE